MSTSTDIHPNNRLFKQLVNSKRLSLAVAVTIFNRGRAEPVTESGLKGWLVEQGAPGWREVSDADLAHATAVFEAIG
jgi:hypothetical protein